MNCSLIELLQAIPDFRAVRGQRYPLWLILSLAILGTLSGCYGYQALEDFCVRHYPALCEHLGVQTKRLPSDSTFRRIFEHLDFQHLADQFNQWAGTQGQSTAGEWFAMDGKAIKGTLAGYSQEYQNFVNVVSLYSHQRGIVVALKQFENQHESEIHVVQALLETLQPSQGVFSFDALHAQKKLCN